MTDGYNVPDKVGVDDLMKKDADDEALQKYKAALVGDAKDKIIDENDKRLIFFDKLVVEPTGADSKRKPIELDPAKCSADAVAFQLKEKATYKVTIKFRVQRDIVSGLKRFMVIKRKGIKVDKSTDMMGSYAPNANKTYEHPFAEDTVPDGMLARGTYVAKVQFIDDDKVVHLEFSYGFKIAKGWED